MDRLVDGGREGHRVAVDTHMEGHQILIALHERHQYKGRRIVSQTPVFTVCGHAGNCAPLAGNLNALADCILAGPVAIDEGLVDDDHGLRGFIVRIGKVAPGQKRRAKSFKIAGPYNSPVSFNGFMRTGNVAFGHDAFGVDGETEGRKVGQRC